ncbi:MarR family transcriptional regulator [Streptacidiphilus sp. PB12-B1b]|nr:MarR family transcriptional regulator [Streptacidiphilus sp. PB12-B1b]
MELLEELLGRGQEALPSGAVSAFQLRALVAIDRYEGMNLRGLCALLGSSPSSVSRLCDRLAALGMVERSPSTVSRREVELRLTRYGRTVVEELRDHRVRRLLELFAVLRPSQLAQLGKGLQLLVDTADASAGSQPGSGRGRAGTA